MSAPDAARDRHHHDVQHDWCGYCRRLKSALDREGIGYTEVNIEDDAGAAPTT